MAKENNEFVSTSDNPVVDKCGGEDKVVIAEIGQRQRQRLTTKTGSLSYQATRVVLAPTFQRLGAGACGT